MKGQFVDTGLCDCRKICAAQSDIRFLGGRRLFLKLKSSVFEYFQCKENRILNLYPNRIHFHKWKRQIVNNFECLPYISKVWLIFLCYGYTWKGLWICQVLAVTLCVHIDAYALSLADNSLPLISLFMCVEFRGWDTSNGLQTKRRQVA